MARERHGQYEPPRIACGSHGGGLAMRWAMPPGMPLVGNDGLDSPRLRGAPRPREPQHECAMRGPLMRRISVLEMTDYWASARLDGR
jgi:hypothetical protein